MYDKTYAVTASVADQALTGVSGNLSSSHAALSSGRHARGCDVAASR